MSIKKIVCPNKNVRWEVVERLPGKGNKRVRRRFDKRIDAQIFLDEFKQRKKETLNPNSLKAEFDIEGTSFNAEANFWLERKEDEFTAGYLRVIGPGLRKIKLHYGHFPISKFTPSLLLEFRSLLKREGLSPATQNRYLDLITRIINFSYAQKRINHNPCIGYERGREVNEEMQFWDADEVQFFLSFAHRKYPRGSEKRWVYIAYLMALETGVRARELWGFKIRDLPLTGTKLKVSRQSLGGVKFVVSPSTNHINLYYRAL